MVTRQVHIQLGHVAEARAEDRKVIKELHSLGLAFQNASGAYMIDNPSKFPAGTLTSALTAEETQKLAGLTNDRAHVNPDTMTHQEMDDHGIYYGVHLHCMFMGVQERYMASLKVSFKDIADSFDVDVSDKAAVEEKLSACERYGFEPLARLLKLKYTP